jgi:hypothetical protein
MSEHGETLTLVKVEKRTGRVIARNTWRTGVQTLIYPHMEAFNAAKKKLEETGEPVPVGGFTELNDS